MYQRVGGTPRACHALGDPAAPPRGPSTPPRRGSSYSSMNRRRVSSVPTSTVRSNSTNTGLRWSCPTGTTRRRASSGTSGCSAGLTTLRGTRCCLGRRDAVSREGGVHCALLRSCGFTSPGRSRRLVLGAAGFRYQKSCRSGRRGRIGCPSYSRTRPVDCRLRCGRRQSRVHRRSWRLR